MVHILGVQLPEQRLTKKAFTLFYGIGQHTAARLCARFQIHDRSRIRDLTNNQITQIAAFLSSPSTAPTTPTFRLAPPSFRPPVVAPALQEPSKRQKEGLKKDPLKDLRIESELRREIRENIAHHRMIGSYVGRRHAMNLPVRGQRTKSNSSTARKLNKIERRG
ncbi:hypothetical protein Clacol_006844 [Clathrus columnatus]|uniref:Mitochondrial ribosomal protein S13 n=1 Tax=Clathrus columnatus TaxID=1419009 RepID=A0AAV5AD78_9AGAM|nr:hypothetical protein Clacol_006844 [Clathrus columnatus]